MNKLSNLQYQIPIQVINFPILLKLIAQAF